MKATTSGSAAKLASQGGTPVRDTFLPISVPDLGPRERERVLEVLDSGWITTGSHALELARRIAQLVHARHAVALSSATGALHLALEALGIGPGDEVITTPYTFVATVNVIEHVRATPVLVDVEPDTLCLDPRRVREAITPRTRVVLGVDYAGHPCDHDALRAATRGHDIRLVDDAAHALGAALDGRPVGSGTLADATAFSFYATKNLTTGEGGALVTDDEKLAERVAHLSLHGMDRDAWKRYGAGGSWFYEVTSAGWKYNLPDLLAALGLAQLERFEAGQRRRRELVARYDAGLAAVPEVRRPRVRPGVTHAWHLYPIALELERLRIDRARFIEELRAENVGTSVHFIPVHYHPYFRDRLGLAPGSLPVAEDAYRRAISLPLFPGMSDRDVDDVVTAVARIVAAHRA